MEGSRVAVLAEGKKDCGARGRGGGRAVEIVAKSADVESFVWKTRRL